MLWLFYTTSILAVFCTPAAASVESRDFACGNGMGQIQGLKTNVCCPGVMKTAPGKTYCCIGGTNDDCGQVTCFTDLSSCQHTVDVDSPDYNDQIQKLTGKKPSNPSGGSSSGSGSSSSSGESGSSSATMPFARSASGSSISPTLPPIIAASATSESIASSTLAPTANHQNTAVEVKAALAAVIGVVVAQPFWYAL
ncbi:uncharacterized protein T069G_11564 [Trichoderma breve]|uniref:Uncharacterized protein n=1 Tax=Trichoderma breve TaxID=2034170 RepID=A0A9W9E2N8_9HYPO|nr:uncharacterized protein T069G_11564 [Trichoderma breve]KAJ4854585.1 hypothetical protein T069G_11564 [Trichoderma breve]